MSDYGYRGPSIDHSLISPSGSMSRRAREDALKREGERLFPGNEYGPGLKGKVSEEEKRISKIASLRHHAATLRDLADRGMSPRKYRKEADKIEMQADEMEAA